MAVYQNNIYTLSIAGAPVASSYQQLTVTSAGTSTLTVPATANTAVIQIETQGNCRWNDDTSVPTATAGNLLLAGNGITLNNRISLTQFKIIATAANVTLNVSYYTN